MILRYTILYVQDVDASMGFYERAFGLERDFMHETGNYGEMVTGQTKLAFSSKDLMRQIGKDVGQANPKHPVFEVAFETDDVEGDYAKALKAGAQPVKAPEAMPWGQVMSYVSDPDGILVEICSPVANPG